MLMFFQADERPVMGMYGVCFDEEMAGNQFRYMIADDFLIEAAKKKNLEEYEIPEGYNIEYYSNSANYKNGTQDAEYYAEVWIPVKEK